MARDHRGDGRTASAVGNVHEVQTDRDTKLFAQQMDGVPKPGDAKLYLPGFALIRVTRSLTVFAGTEGLTESADAKADASVTASKSLNGS
jgi:hypothetical protein